MTDSKFFYIFRSRLVSSTVQAHPVGLITDRNGIYADGNLIKGIYEGINFPIVFKQEYGKKWTDILGTGYVSLYLISDQLKSVLEYNQLTGWTTFPIKLYDKKNNEVMGYQGFSITGKCSPISYDNCEIIERRMVPTGPICRFYKGASIKVWDGSDFFTPESNYKIIISNRAADVLKEHKITNLELTNLAENQVDVDIVNS